MSTDVFNNLWSNPSKQYTYTNLSCSNASSDDELSFNIRESVGEISNNKEVLSSIDLSKISTSLDSFSNSTKIIPANSLLYIGSESTGKSYKRVVYGKFNDRLINSDSWQEKIKISFDISWVKDGNIPAKFVVEAQGSIEEEVIDVINRLLSEQGINVTASLISYNDEDNNLLCFESGKIGYDFYIGGVSYYVNNEDEDSGYYYNEEDALKEYVMEESDYFYIPAFKYNNGAFKGVVIKPVYPKYNIDIEENQKSLKLCHLKDRIAVFVKDGFGNYSKKILDVFGNHFDINEYNSCIILLNEDKKDNYDLSNLWLNDEEKEWTVIENGYKVMRDNYCGLYGYANYATVTNSWTSFGDLYMVMASKDVPNNKDCNLINPIILYNPNNFDVKVNILTLEE
jgi:hypothetical protein